MIQIWRREWKIEKMFLQYIGDATVRRIDYNCAKDQYKCAGRDSNPGQGLGKPLC